MNAKQIDKIFSSPKSRNMSKLISHIEHLYTKLWLQEQLKTHKWIIVKNKALSRLKKRVKGWLFLSKEGAKKRFSEKTLITETGGLTWKKINIFNR